MNDGVHACMRPHPGLKASLNVAFGIVLLLITHQAVGITAPIENLLDEPPPTSGTGAWRNGFGAFNRAGTLSGTQIQGNRMYHTGLDIDATRGETVVRTTGDGTIGLVVGLAPRGGGPSEACPIGNERIAIWHDENDNDAVDMGEIAAPTCTGRTENNHGLGIVVVVTHDSNTHTLYGHLYAIKKEVYDAVILGNGTASVAAGDAIAVVGSSAFDCYETGGDCPDPHLHFEVKESAGLGSPRDDPSTTHWGYTPDLPDVYGYEDPFRYFYPPVANSGGRVALLVIGEEGGSLEVNRGARIYAGPGVKYSVLGWTGLNQALVSTASAVSVPLSDSTSRLWYRIGLPSRLRGPRYGWIASKKSDGTALVQEEPEARIVRVINDTGEGWRLRRDPSVDCNIVSSNCVRVWDNLASLADPDKGYRSVLAWDGVEFVSPTTQSLSGVLWHQIVLPKIYFEDPKTTTKKSSPQDAVVGEITTAWLRDDAVELVPVNEPASYSYMLQDGLNLISFPILPRANGSQLFSDILASLGDDLFPYIFFLTDDGGVDFAPASELFAEAKKAYFVFLSNPRSLSVSGDTVDPGVTLHAGLNLVGVTAQTFPADNANVFPTAFYLQNGTVQIVSIFEAGLAPGVGYFVFSATDGNVLIPGGSSAMTSSSNPIGTISFDRMTSLVSGAGIGSNFTVQLDVAQTGAPATVSLELGTHSGASNGYDSEVDVIRPVPLPGDLVAFFDESFGLLSSFKGAASSVEWPLAIFSQSTFPGSNDNQNPVQLSWTIPPSGSTGPDTVFELLDSNRNVIIPDMRTVLQTSFSVVGPSTYRRYIVRARSSTGPTPTPTSTPTRTPTSSPASHLITFLSGPTGSPNPVNSGGSVALSVSASDSLNHTLSYIWTAICPGLPALPPNGGFTFPMNPTTNWTAPQNTTGMQQSCTISVTAGDGTGLTRMGSYIQHVRPISPDSVTLTPSSLSGIGPYNIGQSSPEMTVSINNNTGSTIQVLIYVAAGGNSEDFQVGCQTVGTWFPMSSTLSPFCVTFTPQGCGTRTGVVVVDYQPPASPILTLTLPIEGLGPACTPTPTATPTATATPTHTFTPVPTPGANADFVWTETSPCPITGYVLASAASGSKLYAMGSEANIRANYEYNAHTDSWAIRASAPNNLQSGGAVAQNDLVYVVPGSDPFQVQIYDPQQDEWTLGAALPRPRSDFAVAVADGKVFAIGGDSSNLVDAYDPITDTWEMRADMPTARRNATAAGLNGKVYVMGGDFEGSILGAFEIYDAATNTWSAGPPPLTHRFDAHSAVLFGKFYLIGGYATGSNLGPSALVEQYDPALGFWTRKTAMLTARMQAAVGVANGKIYVAAGLTTGFAPINLAEEGRLVDPETPTPTRTPTQTPTATRTSTPTPSASPSSTPTSTFSPTNTPTSTRTLTRTSTPSATPTRTPTPSATPTPTPSTTSTPTATLTITPSPTLAVHAIDGRIFYHNGNLPVPDVTVWLRNGSEVLSDQTAADGRYILSNISSEQWTVEPEKVGDIGLSISSLDAAWLLQAVVGLREFDEYQTLACDVTGNGSLSSLDAARILQYRVGLLERFHAAELCGSDWLFVPSPAGIQNQVVTPPLLTQDSCSPGRIIFTPLADSVTMQDFIAVLFGDCTGNWQPSAP